MRCMKTNDKLWIFKVNKNVQCAEYGIEKLDIKYAFFDVFKILRYQEVPDLPESGTDKYK